MLPQFKKFLRNNVYEYLTCRFEITSNGLVVFWRGHQNDQTEVMRLLDEAFPGVYTYNAPVDLSSEIPYMGILRQRQHVAEDDCSMDGHIKAMSCEDKIRNVVAWSYGYGSHLDQMISIVTAFDGGYLFQKP